MATTILDVRRLQSPALHFAVVGALLFTVSRCLAPQPETSVPETTLTLSATRLDQSYDVFLASHHRAPDVEEREAMVRRLVDEEILLRHALALGMDRQAPVQRRLAQIGRFVGEAPSPSAGSVEDAERWALEAKALGLHREDTVVRRILVDSARRLIRGAVLTREPSEEAMREHLGRHPDRFQLPEAIAFDWIRDGGAIGSSESIPLLPRADLERRFGHAFVAALAPRKQGEWQGPLPSRNGPIFVRVTEHRPRRTADLADVEVHVRREAAEVLADRWLEVRLRQLRDGVDVERPAGWEAPRPAQLRAVLSTTTENGSPS